MLSDLKAEVSLIRYPRRLRDLVGLEAGAVESGAYSSRAVHALVQTEEYARALLGMGRPARPADVLERLVAEVLARQAIFTRTPSVTLTFVVEEVVLRRPVGGRAVLRRQLEHLLELGGLRHVEIQVMPTEREDHAGLDGERHVLKLTDGTAVGCCEAQLARRLITDPSTSWNCATASSAPRPLSPRESTTFIEKVMSET